MLAAGPAGRAVRRLGVRGQPGRRHAPGPPAPVDRIGHGVDPVAQRLRLAKVLRRTAHHGVVGEQRVRLRRRLGKEDAFRMADPPPLRMRSDDLAGSFDPPCLRIRRGPRKTPDLQCRPHVELREPPRR